MPHINSIHNIYMIDNHYTYDLSSIDEMILQMDLLKWYDYNTIIFIGDLGFR